MSVDLDVVVVGGGHNGLVAAALLASAGLAVRVVERRERLGGFAGTVEVRDGIRVPLAADDWGLLRADLVEELGLERHGLPAAGPELFAVACDGAGSPGVPLWRDVERTAAELARAPGSAGTGWRALVAEIATHGEQLEELVRRPPVLADLGRTLRRPELVRALALPAAERIGRHLPDGPVAAGLAVLAVAGSPHGPRAAGSGWLLQAQLAGTTAERLRPLRRQPEGGPALADALGAAAEAAGATIARGLAVERVLTERAPGRSPRAIGVRLAGGEEIRSRWVLSNLDPRSTLLGLVGAQQLEVATIRELRQGLYRGVRSRLLLVVERRGLEGAPEGWLGSGARLWLAAGVAEVEGAADAAKYGRCSQRPALEVFEGPTQDGATAILVNAQWSPRALRDDAGAPASWDAGARRDWQNAILARLEGALPALGEGVLARRLLTPEDWERELGASEGSESHGEMGLEQMFALRGLPLAGGGPATGVDGLLLCGAGAHPGGSLTGLPGWHAARAVLADAS
ncbi:MAG TPA: NAD(P)-binding protein [Thermoanaerobaculia bacterium]|nr:NAD(P)-binding protein [Thermoanaerobaculia bacterium]